MKKLWLKRKIFPLTGLRLFNVCKKIFWKWENQKQTPRGVLKIWSKFKGEHPCQSLSSIKLLWNFIEITLRHGWSPINLLHIFRTPFTKITSGWLLLENVESVIDISHEYISSSNLVWFMYLESPLNIFLRFCLQIVILIMSDISFGWCNESLSKIHDSINRLFLKRNYQTGACWRKWLEEHWRFW